jgi:hypothetical protein
MPRSDEIGAEIDALVTTDHMFHLGRPRFATVFATELRPSREQLQLERPPGAGAAQRIPLESALSITSHGNFIPNGQRKKSSAAPHPARNRRQIE